MAYSLNGSNQYIDCGNPAGLNPTVPFTVLCKLVPGGGGSYNGTLISRTQSGSNGWQFLRRDQNFLRFTKLGVVDLSANSVTVATGVEQLVAAIVTSTAVKFVRVTTDGSVLSQTVANSQGFVGTPNMARIGERAGSHYQGSIWDVAKYNAALTDDELIAMAIGGRPPDVRAAGLAFYAPLTRELTEWVGGATLTAVNSPTVADSGRIILPRRRTIIQVPAAGETVVGAGGSLHPIGIGAVGLARGLSAIEYGSPT